MSGTLRMTRAASGSVRMVLVLPQRDGDPLEILITATPAGAPGEYVVQVDPADAVRAVAR